MNKRSLLLGLLLVAIGPIAQATERVLTVFAAASPAGASFGAVCRSSIFGGASVLLLAASGQSNGGNQGSEQNRLVHVCPQGH